MAPIAYIPGGNIKPIINKDIQLYCETIDIVLKQDCYFVEVNYTFVNHGKSQIVEMGFPSNEKYKVIDFSAYVDEIPILTKTKPGYWNFKLKSKYIGADILDSTINAFECFNVNFDEGETKHIRNTYKQEYTPNYGGGRVSFFYILKTGSLWKDKIESIELNVNSDKAPNLFKLTEGYFNDSLTSFVNFKRKYLNIEPVNDLFFAINLKKNFDATRASSELVPIGNNKYVIKNVEDGDKSTAWIEGVDGYGIGESLNFYTNLGHNLGEVLELDSIGIMNGYAKNINTYNDNSRVKQLLITSQVDNDRDEDYNKSIKKIIYLKDSPEMQYFKFETPIKATDIELKILDVYKGLKYKDTAISEVVFFVNQNK